MKRGKRTTWGEVIDGRKTYRLHKGQSGVLRSESRFTAALAGTGGGKTVTGPLWIAKQIKRILDSERDLTIDPILGMVLAPTKAILGRATLRVFLQTFQGTELQGVYRKGTGLEPPHYILPNDLGIVYLLSGFVPDNIEGDQYDFAWLDEGAQLTKGAWIAIQGRTGMKRSPVLITSTIYRLNWIKKEVLKRYRADDPDYTVVSWSSILNPEYPREEYDRAKRTLTPALFGMRYDGIVPENDALVFSSFDFDEHTRDCEYDDSRPIMVGCNFSSNPLAWVLAHPGPQGIVEVFDEMILRDATTQSALDMFYVLYGEHKGGFRFYGDAIRRDTKTTASLSDYQLIHTDYRFGRRTITAPEVPIDPIDRIASTNARFKTPQGGHKLFIDRERCPTLIADLESRFRDEDWRHPLTFKKNDGAGPISDALSFIVHQVHPLAAVPGGAVVIGGSK